MFVLFGVNCLRWFRFELAASCRSKQRSANGSRQCVWLAEKCQIRAVLAWIWGGPREAPPSLRLCWVAQNWFVPMECRQDLRAQAGDDGAMRSRDMGANEPMCVCVCVCRVSNSFTNYVYICIYTHTETNAPTHLARTRKSFERKRDESRIEFNTLCVTLVLMVFWILDTIYRIVACVRVVTLIRNRGSCGACSEITHGALFPSLLIGSNASCCCAVASARARDCVCVCVWNRTVVYLNLTSSW